MDLSGSVFAIVTVAVILKNSSRNRTTRATATIIVTALILGLVVAVLLILVVNILEVIIVINNSANLRFVSTLKARLMRLQMELDAHRGLGLRESRAKGSKYPRIEFRNTSCSTGGFDWGTV